MNQNAYSQAKLELLLNNNSYPSTAYTSQSIVYGEKIIFSARTNEYGNELWILNSSESKPKLLKDVNPGIKSSHPSNFIIFKDKVLFRAVTENNGYEIWVTDGSEQNTYILEDLYPGPDSSNPGLFRINAENQFLSFIAKQPDIGTEFCFLANLESKIKCFDIELGKRSSQVSNITEFKESILFNHYSDNKILFFNPNLSEPQELPSGILVGEVTGGYQGKKLFLNNQEVLFYVGREFRNRGLYLSQSLESPGVELNSTIENAGNFINLNESVLLFSAKDSEHGIELWRTDGTADGTYLLKDIFPGVVGYEFSSFTLFNGVIYFSAETKESGKEIWRSDGTTKGTYILKDIFPGPQSGAPANFTLFNNKLYFTSNTQEFGLEIYSTEGSSASTIMFNDLREGFQSSSPKTFHQYSDKLVFFAEGSKPSIYFLNKNNTLSSIPILGSGDNGTDINSLVKITDNLSFLNIDDPSLGVEPFVYNHALNKITLLKDINPGYQNSYPSVISKIGDKIYFRADDFEHGIELWVTDGTSANTKLLKDINPGVIGSAPYAFGKSKLHNGFFYFLAYSNDFGNEIWRSNGTEKGTELFLDLNKGPDSGFSDSKIVTALGDDLYFGAKEVNDKVEVFKLNLTTKSLEKITNSSTDKVDKVYSIFSNEDSVLFGRYSKDNGIKLYSYNTNTKLINDLGDINLTTYSEDVKYLNISGNIITRVSVDNKNYMARFRHPYSSENIDLFKFEKDIEGEGFIGGPYLVNDQVIFPTISASKSRNLWKLNFSNMQAERLNSSDFKLMSILTEKYLCNAKKTILIANVDENNTELYETDGSTFTKINLQGASPEFIYYPEVTQVRGNDLILLGNNKQYGSELWQIKNLFGSDMKCTIEPEEPFQENLLRTFYIILKSFKLKNIKTHKKSIKEIKKSFSAFNKGSKETIKSFTKSNNKKVKKNITVLKSSLKTFYKISDKNSKKKCIKLTKSLLRFFP